MTREEVSEGVIKMTRAEVAARIVSIITVLKILEEMTEEEMRKAGYSKVKIKGMMQWVKSTKAILSGLKEEYIKAYEEMIEKEEEK